MNLTNVLCETLRMVRNPFNGVPFYVGLKKMRCIVFWSKNHAPISNTTAAWTIV